MKLKLATLLLGLIFVSPVSYAQQPPKNEPSQKEPIEIPINFGVGPSFHLLNSSVTGRNQTIYGLNLDLAAVITDEMVEKHKHRLPEKYRNVASKLGEGKVGLLLIPETIYISPMHNNLEVYGATWSPLKLGLMYKVFGTKVGLGIPLKLTYMHIRDFNKEKPIHFARPALGWNFEWAVPLARWFLLSAHVGRDYYWPQSFAPGRTLHRIDYASAMLHLRYHFKTEF